MRTDGTADPPTGGIDAGALLEDRDYIKVTTQSFSRALIRQVLEAMDDRRRARRVASERPVRLPEMSLAEMQREIVWRLGTLPPEDARAIAAFVRRLVPTAR